jgi:hypothetical protein
MVPRSSPLSLVMAVSPFPLTAARTAFVDPKRLKAHCSWRAFHVAQYLYPLSRRRQQMAQRSVDPGVYDTLHAEGHRPFPRVLKCLRLAERQRGWPTPRNMQKFLIHAITGG